jgi:hypothetical protein
VKTRARLPESTESERIAFEARAFDAWTARVSAFLSANTGFPLNHRMDDGSPGWNYCPAESLLAMHDAGECHKDAARMVANGSYPPAIALDSSAGRA